MRRFILGVIIFTLMSMFCFSVFGKDWRDEEHIWNEEKGRFEVHNKAHGRIVEEKRREVKFQPPTEEWARYLPSSVRYGKREATEREIERAQEKLWIKEMITVRAMKKAEDRRQLIQYRKASGWYAARRAGNHDVGWSMRMHVRAAGY